LKVSSVFPRFFLLYPAALAVFLAVHLCSAPAAAAAEHLLASEAGAAQGQLLENPFLPAFLLLIWIFLVLLTRPQAGRSLFNLGRLRPALQQKSGTTFADVAGLRAEKEELREIIFYLKDPARYAAMGARLPRGVLLAGPAGTGKTLLARAVAGEAGVPFFSVSGSEFVEMLVGVGAARVRDLFRQAQRKAPAVVFIDELDALGRRRGTAGHASHEEAELTLNQLLVELDGFDQRKGVVVLAATNRPDILDPALLRPGRFDRQITVDFPGQEDREEILRLHSRNKPLVRSVSFKTLARLTGGFTGADLENLVNEAALLAVRRNRKKIGRAELDEALERALAGIRNSCSDNFDEEVAAVHESGHALVAYMLLGEKVLYKVSVVPRCRSGDQTLFLNSKSSFITASELMSRIATLLGGRAAEEEVFGEVSTGCQDDLVQATMLARQMVYQQGMGTKLGLAVLQCGHGCTPEGEKLSEKTLETAEEEVRRLLEGCYREAQRVVSECIVQLHNLAGTLQVKKTLRAKEIKQVLEG